MNIEKYLIIVRNGERRKDRTEEIIKYEYADRFVNVFYNSRMEPYTYSKNNFKFYKDPTEINIEENEVILNGGYLYNLMKVLCFTEFYRIIFNDGTNIVEPSYCVQIEKKNKDKAVSTDKFRYFKDVSKIVSIKTEQGAALLTNEYEKISFVNRETALYYYLNPDDYVEQKNDKIDTIIYPFGANNSQFKAVKEAMENQISIIEGPPGTGKTQTILNIIANIVKRGQTVAVVSNNNSATDNIYEKMQKYGLEYICAQLGKRDNKKEFINNQTGQYPEFDEPIEGRNELETKIEKLNSDIVKIFELKNKMAILKNELSQIQLEHMYFNKQEGKSLHEIPKIRNLKKVSSNKVLKLKIECEELEMNNKPVNLLFKIKSAWIYGIGKISFYNMEIKQLLKIYDKLFFIIKEIELKEQIKECSRKLEILESEDKLEVLTKDSMILFKEYLREKYNAKIKRKVFELEDLYINPSIFNEEYPVVLSTTHSIKSCFESNYKFDYIIMDEASQVDLITGVLALSAGKKAIIVGDLKQLPNVITTNNYVQIKELSKKYRIPEQYDYLKNSFLASIEKVLDKAPKTLLQEHYRCHPKIIGFCNKKFYDDQLIVMTEDKGEEDILKAYVTVEGNHARGHYNQRQIDIINKEILPELKGKVKREEIGIISPYREQKKNLKRTVEDIEIDTVHKFQGREQDAIVLTTVDNEISEFVDNPKMLNVAITRAKKYLRVVVSNNKENEGTNIDDLIKYIQYNNFEVEESNVKSIYDLLYKQNTKQRMEYLKGKQRISDYNSENLTYTLIKEVIQKNNYDNLDVAVHIPLNALLKKLDMLEEREKEFAQNTWTHVDFVIYNKMDKKMVIAVEVDGYYYHKEGSMQEQRDRLKDKILEKYNIPLVRLNTVGSNEKEKIEKAIEEMFKQNTKQISYNT